MSEWHVCELTHADWDTKKGQLQQTHHTTRGTGYVCFMGNTYLHNAGRARVVGQTQRKIALCWVGGNHIDGPAPVVCDYNTILGITPIDVQRR